MILPLGGQFGFGNLSPLSSELSQIKYFSHFDPQEESDT